ncbi:hypothetical protein UlMin_003651, partial [Ulmus minor]
VVTHYDSLDEYLKIVDAFVDIILQNKIESHLKIILEGISKRTCGEGTAEDEQASLQSILVKLLSHYERIENVFALRETQHYFLEILDLMYGSSRSIINMHSLDMATRNGCICDPTTIQLLFEISMVDYGSEMEHHLTFLVECRGAFGRINGLKEILIHSSYFLAIKALRYDNKHLALVKSCIAFCEVTLPSISSQIRQLNLYLETSEVIFACIGSKMPGNADGILSSIGKLCSLLVMIPGNPDVGVTYFPKTILSLIQLQIMPKMREKVFCAIVSMSATVSQNVLPYHVDNGKGDSSYSNEFASLSNLALQHLVDSVQQELSSAARGILALEACNCIASSFSPSSETALICTKPIETANSCLSKRDRFLQSTVKFLDKFLTIGLNGRRVRQSFHVWYLT